MVVRTECGKYGIRDVFWTLPPQIESRDVNQLLFSEISVSDMFIFYLFLKSQVAAYSV